MRKLLTETIKEKKFNNIRLIATDMDGTLTKNGKFSSDLIVSFECLAVHKIDVLIVTGRSAGWVNGIANYLPIVGAIAENGGLFFDNVTDGIEFVTSIAEIDKHRQQLKKIFDLVQREFPEIKESQDNLFRLTDWTFDIGSLNRQQLEKIANICQQENWGFTYSTVQCHIKPLLQDKATGLQQIIKSYFPQLKPEEIITVGDSPNDESLFNPKLFPLSVGVANISNYWDVLIYQPSFITNQPEGAGFCELAKMIISRANN